MRHCCRFLLSDTLFWNALPEAMPGPEVGEQSAAASALTSASMSTSASASASTSVLWIYVFVCVCMYIRKYVYVIHSTLRCIEISFSLSFRTLQNANTYTRSHSLIGTDSLLLCALFTALTPYDYCLTAALTCSLAHLLSCSSALQFLHSCALCRHSCCWLCHPLKAKTLPFYLRVCVWEGVCVCVCSSIWVNLKFLEKTGNATLWLANGRKWYGHLIESECALSISVCIHVCMFMLAPFMSCIRNVTSDHRELLLATTTIKMRSGSTLVC